MQSARPSIIFQERPADEQKKKREKRKKRQKEKIIAGARYPGEDRARGDERWLYKRGVEEEGEGNGEKVAACNNPI